MMTTTKSEAFPKALKADKLLTKTKIREAENRKGNNLRFKCLRLELHIKILPMVFKLNSWEVVDQMLWIQHKQTNFWMLVEPASSIGFSSRCTIRQNVNIFTSGSSLWDAFWSFLPW